ncbi:MAG: molybdopterin-binding protein [Anaerolineales bacterium]|nr:molybdopterin-binding protein [Anaerolineales bacterium]MCS7247799.1 molybdopterin-binding protein [Anaerolineales bacterium]MDW8161609.1 molybdopterin-binding protein [Anaerolineales bacterium]MDW8446299.1 molybdopterin-binding protein [Anaerolineales bacterium]
MPEFLTLLTPQEARQKVFEALTPQVKLAVESVPTQEALGRVSAREVRAPHPLPMFNRATVDGYAVRAEDTFGASESLPAYFRVVTEVGMGQETTVTLGSMEAALIHTGGMLPPNANAVVMIEQTQRIAEDEIEVYRAASPWENTIRIGEEVKEGEVVLPRHKRIRPVEVGGLLALGILQVEVVKKPKVGIISSGDEVVPPDAPLRLGQVRDVNTYTLSALVSQCGGEPLPYGILPDQEEALKKALDELKAKCDMILITAGSSVSARDYTARAIQQMGAPGVLAHGINTRPGKPTIFAVCDGIPVIGLPGNPMSAYVIALHFVRPILFLLQGLPPEEMKPQVEATLTVNLSSTAGREDWVPVRLVQDAEGLRADPVFGKSNMILALSRADGLIRIPAAATGLAAGEKVQVELLE